MAAAPSLDTTGTSQQVRNTDYPLMDYTDGPNLLIYVKVGKKFYPSNREYCYLRPASGLGRLVIINGINYNKHAFFSLPENTINNYTLALSLPHAERKKVVWVWPTCSSSVKSREQPTTGPALLTSLFSPFLSLYELPHPSRTLQSRTSLPLYHVPSVFMYACMHVTFLHSSEVNVI